MKILRICLFILATFVCGKVFGQPVKLETEVIWTNYYVSAEIGTISGTLVYNFIFRISKDGLIESAHWNVKNCKLQNEHGDKVIMVDSGHDSFGFIWGFFNYPNTSNGIYYPSIDYKITEGWLDEYMPETLPYDEGTMVNMSFKMACKGEKWDLLAGMVILHRNAKGEITAEVIKPDVD